MGENYKCRLALNRADDLGDIIPRARLLGLLVVRHLHSVWAGVAQTRRHPHVVWRHGVGGCGHA
jgi:hypothetical protein